MRECAYVCARACMCVCACACVCMYACMCAYTLGVGMFTRGVQVMIGVTDHVTFGLPRLFVFLCFI